MLNVSYTTEPVMSISGMWLLRGLPDVPKIFCTEGSLFQRFVVPKVRCSEG